MPTPPDAAPAALPIWREPDFARGVRDITPVSLGIAAWGLVTGVAMHKSGLAPMLALAMSLLVYAGSAQLAALPLLTSGAPIWMIWAIAFCVNLRFVVFSAQWRPYFASMPRWARVAHGYFTGDLNYVVFMARFPDPRPDPAHRPYYWGLTVVSWLAWQVPSLLGYVLADRIPTAWGFGFAGILALLGLLYALLVSRESRIAAVVASTAAIATAALPLKLNMVVAIAAAIATGVVMDRARPEAAR